MSVYDLTDFSPQCSRESTGSVCRRLTGRGIASSQQGRMGIRRQKPLVSVFLFPLSSPSHRGTTAAASAMRGEEAWELKHWVLPSGSSSTSCSPSRRAKPASSQSEGRHGQWWTERVCTQRQSSWRTLRMPRRRQPPCLDPLCPPGWGGNSFIQPTPQHGSCPRSCPWQTPTSSTSR